MALGSLLLTCTSAIEVHVHNIVVRIAPKRCLASPGFSSRGPEEPTDFRTNVRSFPTVKGYRTTRGRFCLLLTDASSQVSCPREQPPIKAVLLTCWAILCIGTARHLPSYLGFDDHPKATPVHYVWPECLTFLAYARDWNRLHFIGSPDMHPLKSRLDLETTVQDIAV